MQKKMVEKITFQNVVKKSRKCKSPVAAAMKVELKGEEHLIVDIAIQGQEALRLVYTEKAYMAQTRDYPRIVDWKQMKKGEWTTIRSDDFQYDNRKGGRKYVTSDMRLMNQHDDAMIREFLNYGDRWHLRDAFSTKEHEIRHEKIERAEDRRKERLDGMLNRIPEIPKQFEKWAKQQLQEYVIFYDAYKRKKTTSGYCSGCGQTAEYGRGQLQHRMVTRCKVCGRTATAERESEKGGEIIKKSKVVGLLQMTADGLVQRTFLVGTVAERGFEQRYELEEYGRKYVTFLKNGKLKIVKHYRKYGYKYSFWDDRDFYGPAHYNISCKNIWPGNVDRALIAGTQYQYSGVELLVRHKVEMDAIDYIEEYMGNQALEVFVKMGLFKLLVDKWRLRGAWEKMKHGMKPWEVLEITKEQLNRLIAVNGGWWEVDALRTESGIKMDEETLRWFGKEKLREKTLKTLLALNISHKKVKNYIEKQKKNYLAMSSGQIAEQWCDYLAMAKILRYDLNSSLLAMPSNLKMAHDQAVKQTSSIGEVRRASEIMEKFPKLQEVFENLQRYNWPQNLEEESDYCIVTPANVLDVIKEGRALGHCLANSDRYFERMDQDESFIVFLRKTADREQPYCTLEIQPGGTIRQKQVTGGVPLKDEDAIVWLKDWQKILSAQLTEEEKNREKRSTEIRLADYKKLREDKERVRNGRFQGMLLADVLEDDLLVAE